MADDGILVWAWRERDNAVFWPADGLNAPGFSLVNAKDSQETKPRIVNSFEVIQIISGAVLSGNPDVEGFGDSQSLGGHFVGKAVGNFFFPGQTGEVKGMLFLVGAVKQADDDFISGICFQDWGCRIPITPGSSWEPGTSGGCSGRSPKVPLIKPGYPGWHLSLGGGVALSFRGRSGEQVCRPAMFRYRPPVGRECATVSTCLHENEDKDDSGK